MSNVWLIVTKQGEAAALAAMLKGGAADASVLAIGARGVAEEAACGMAAVKWIDAQGAPAEAYAQAAADELEKAGAEAVLGFATPGVRAAFGIVAARQGASVVSNTVSVDAQGDVLSVEHTVIDDKVIETLSVPAPACLLASTLTFQPVEPDAAALKAAIEQVAATACAAVELVASEPIPPSGVETAERVVGVGRGVNKPELFEEAKKLAGVLGAELSGTMPGVKDFGYFGESSDYIGLSGVRLNSKLYVALGISGSTPHLPGLINAGTVVAVNDDENAQIFDHADYGIVGDVAEVIPALQRALG